MHTLRENQKNHSKKQLDKAREARKLYHVITMWMSWAPKLEVKIIGNKNFETSSMSVLKSCTRLKWVQLAQACTSDIACAMPGQLNHNHFELQPN